MVLHLHARRSALVFGAALTALTACSERGADSPAAPQVIDLVAGSGRDILDSLGITGEPLDFTDVVAVDWPDDPPAHFFDNAALVDAVSAADGQVHVWFKPPDAPKLTDRVRGPPGERYTLTQPVPAAISREGRAFLESQDADITLPFRHIPAVVARIAPELAPVIRAHPLVDYVEPVAVHRLGDASATRAGAAPSPPSANAVPALMAAQVIPDNIQKIRAPNAWPITISGPTSVPPNQVCTWQAFVSGGKPPYAYQWSGVLSGTQSSVSGGISNSGWLFLEVTADDGQQDNRQLWINVDAGAPPCAE